MIKVLCNNVGSLSTEVAVATTFVMTFILTLIIATIITAIITYICVKQKFERIIQDLKNKEQGKIVLYEQVGPSNQAITKDGLELQPNPVYGTSRELIYNGYQSCL